MVYLLLIALVVLQEANNGAMAGRIKQLQSALAESKVRAKEEADILHSQLQVGVTGCIANTHSHSARTMSLGRSPVVGDTSALTGGCDRLHQLMILITRQRCPIGEDHMVGS